MKKLIRWGLAAGLAAALGLHVDAQAQSASGSPGSSSASGSRGDTGGPTPGGADRSTAGRETTPQGGAAGTSSDSGSRSSSTAGQSGTSGATGSAGTDPSSSGAQASGQASGQAKSGQGKVDKGLQERLERIHAMNQAEVQMGQLGTQQATSPEVKQFAEHMQTDHQKADQKLTQTAQSSGVTSLEGKTFQKESDSAKKDMQKLQSKQGADFDKEFMSRMVKDHEKALKEVEKAQKDAQKANQTELASLLQQTHTGMKGHLDHAKQVEKSLKDQGQRQGRRPTGSTSGTGAGAPPERGTAAGSRGDTGGPTPTGKDRSSATQETTPKGGAAGTSSDSGQRTTK